MMISLQPWLRPNFEGWSQKMVMRIFCGLHFRTDLKSIIFGQGNRDGNDIRKFG